MTFFSNKNNKVPPKRIIKKRDTILTNIIKNLRLFYYLAGKCGGICDKYHKGI